MRAIILIAIVSIGALPLPLAAQASSGALRVEDLMSAQQFQRAGLTRLSAEELSQLNTWLALYTRAVAQAAASQSNAPRNAGPVASPAVIESRIDGEFSGWEGETIFKLLNGQIWQQSSYAYKYHYAYSPKVIIYRSESGYRMKVDGVNGEISVRQLK